MKNYPWNLFLSSILSLTHSSRDTWDWRITGGMKPWVGKEYISSSYNFWVIFFHLILELLFCNKGIADWIRARHAIPLAFSFGPTSFSINLESWFLSYGRILTLHYYFLLMCILFSLMSLFLESVYSCVFFFLTGLHFFHLVVGLLLLSLLFWSCSLSSFFILNYISYY